MKFLKRIMTAVGLAAGIAAPALAQQTITLDVLYCYPSFARFHEPLANEFMKKNPQIKIQFRAPSASYDEGHQVILRSAITNQLPDVYYAGYHLLGEMARTLEKRGQINDLAPFLKTEPANYASANFAPRMMSLSQVDGKQYGLAFNASSPIMYFNTDLVKRAGGDPKNMPDTWDGLIKLAAKIKTLGNDVSGVSYDVHAWPDDWLFQGMIYQLAASWSSRAPKRQASTTSRVCKRSRPCAASSLKAACNWWIGTNPVRHLGLVKRASSSRRRPT